MAEEKIYTVPLRKGFLKAPGYDRSRKAKVTLKEFLEKHLKKEVKIGKYLNLELWKRGRKHPPSKIQVRIEERKDETIVELINAPREERKEIKETKKNIEAIEKVPEKTKIVDSEKREAEPADQERHRKEEKVIAQTGKTKSRTS